MMKFIYTIIWAMYLTLVHHDSFEFMVIISLWFIYMSLENKD